jgi:hypothetical protein
MMLAVYRSLAVYESVQGNVEGTSFQVEKGFKLEVEFFLNSTYSVKRKYPFALMGGIDRFEGMNDSLLSIDSSMGLVPLCKTSAEPKQRF